MRLLYDGPLGAAYARRASPAIGGAELAMDHAARPSMLGVVGPARAFLALRAAGKCLGRQSNAITSASRVPAAALAGV